MLWRKYRVGLVGAALAVLGGTALAGSVKPTVVAGALGQINRAEKVLRADYATRNDVEAFMYSWFAAFDHMRDVKFFLRSLPKKGFNFILPENFTVDSIGEVTRISSRKDFSTWYGELVSTFSTLKAHVKFLDAKSITHNRWRLVVLTEWNGTLANNGQSFTSRTLSQLDLVRGHKTFVVHNLRVSLQPRPMGGNDGMMSDDGTGEVMSLDVAGRSSVSPRLSSFMPTPEIKAYNRGRRAKERKAAEKKK